MKTIDERLGEVLDMHPMTDYYGDHTAEDIAEFQRNLAARGLAVVPVQGNASLAPEPCQREANDVRYRPRRATGYAFLDPKGRIIVNSVAATPSECRLRAGEGKLFEVEIRIKPPVDPAHRVTQSCGAG